LPVIATILTNIASLFPILLATGTLGIFLSIIPQVAIFALVFSLVEALTILPSHCADFVKITKESGFISRGFKRFRKRYLGYLLLSLKFRYQVIGMSCILLFISCVILFKIPFVLLYSADINQYLIKIQNPTNYSLSLTSDKSKEVEDIVRKHTPKELLKNSLTTLGIDFSKKPPVFGDHVSNILVQFKDFEEREQNGLKSMKEIQRITADEIVGPTNISFVETTGPPKGKDIDIRIIGEDTVLLSEISKEIKTFLKGKNGVYGITDNLSYGKTRLSIKVNEQKASLYGIDTLTLGKEIRALIDGLSIDETRVNNEKADIKIRITNSLNKDSALDVSSHLIRSSNGSYIPISNFTDNVVSSDLITISRFNRERAVSIVAEIDNDVTTPRKIIKSVIKFFDSVKEKYPGYKLALDGEEQDTRESLESVKRASIFSILIIYLILATILRSYIQPLLIMSILPFTIIGVTIGVLVRGDPISITGLIGIVALLGVVINDSLILMNFINKGVKNKNYIMSIFYSAKHRFRAIILTTLTTFGGLSTLMFETRGEAAYLAPMAISLGVGLVFATFLTLFLIPCLYLCFIDLKKKFA